MTLLLCNAVAMEVIDLLIYWNLSFFNIFVANLVNWDLSLSNHSEFDPSTNNLTAFSYIVCIYVCFNAIE